MPDLVEEHSAQLRDASFQTVVDAEKASEQRLAACRKDANRIRQEAAGTERHIATRTDERLQKLHAANHVHIADMEQALRAEFEAERQTLAAEPEPGEIAAAAARLARKLVGLDTE